MTAFHAAVRRTRLQEERGATAVLAGVLMVGLVGFTGLAVDGGATYAKHQELQNGADAAALAAAHECADDEDNCHDAYLQSEAGPYGEANVRADTDTVSTSFDVDLAAQTVTATVTGTRFHWFMPVVGVSESELSPDATATWGSPYRGPSMLPLTISQCEFEGRLGAPELDTVVDIYVPKRGQDAPCSWGSTYPPGGFGWLTNSGCEVTVTVGEWINSSGGTDAPRDCDWSSFINEVVLVPIFDEYAGTGAGGNDGGRYHIARFAAMEVLGIRPSNGNDQYGERCTTDPVPQQNYHQACIRGRFIEYVSTADGYETDPDVDNEVKIVRLID
jgi:Flp pilus assembly protein TadG